MRLRITAEVKGDIILKEKISTQFFIYTFNVFNKNESLFISVEKSVSNYLNDIPKTSFDESNHFAISIPDATICADMVEWLKKIEAFGSFNLAIKRVLYEEAEITWIPETMDEEKLLSIKAYKVTKGRQNSKYLRLSDFQDTLFYSKRLDENYIPLSYFRLGFSFFDEEEYYLSYINYFMMIEYLYANGQTQQDKAKREFAKSKVLTLSILMTIKAFPQNDSNIEWLKKECKNRSKKYDIDGVLYILIKYRGTIAHGSKNRSKIYRKEQQLLRPITFILGMICKYVCGYLQLLSTVNDVQKDDYLNARLQELDTL